MSLKGPQEHCWLLYIEQASHIELFYSWWWQCKQSVLVIVLIVVIKWHGLKQLGNDLFQLKLWQHSLPLKRFKTGTWKQKLRNSLRNSAYWFVPHGLLSLFAFITQDHLNWDGNAHNELDPFTSVINQENDWQTCQQANHMEPFSQWRGLLSKLH